VVRSVILCAFINLLFFLALSIYPSASKEKHEFSETGFKETLSRIIPTSEFGSAVIGILLTAVLAVIFTSLSVNVLNQYGWGLFIGIPFFLGLNSVLFEFNVHIEIVTGFEIDSATAEGQSGLSP